MSKEHFFKIGVQWTGNNGVGTQTYTSYERSHIISANNKIDILASADAAFKGDNTKYNPEDFLIASIASCHMLWFLHFCADNNVVVTNYTDNPTGILLQNENGSGKFTNVTLHPKVTVKSNDMLSQLKDLHIKAHQFCFIANSVNFPVLVEDTGNANS